MVGEHKSCCSTPPETEQDEGSRKAFKKFAVGFMVVIVLMIVGLFFVQNTPIGRHFFMSPQEMEQHIQ